MTTERSKPLTIEQIYTVLNGAATQAVGAGAIAAVDTASFISLGNSSVNVGFAIVTQPEDVLKAIGEVAQFHVEAVGTDLRYQWQLSRNNGIDWQVSGNTGNKTDTLIVDVIAQRNNNMYRCIVTSGKKSLTSEAATLHVVGLE